MSDLSGQLECGCQEREADYRIPHGRWQGWRRFYVKSLKQESADITSLYLYPVDKKTIPLARAGQFICIEVEVPGVGPRRRNYSLSSTPSDEYFRISVKEVPDGLVSPLLTRKVKAGDEFEVSGPYGEFFFQPRNKPIALISGGCGIAPIVSLAEEIAKIGYKQEVRYIHTTQRAENEAFAEEIKKFAEEGRLKADIFYTRVNELPPNLKNVTYHKGHISPEFFKQIITQDMDCYICGPQGVMFGSINALKAMGIPESQLFYELNACI